MARAKEQAVGRQRARNSWDVWRGQEGRCGGCQTRRRPVHRYALSANKGRRLCDRCLIDESLAGCLYLPWEQREAYRDNLGAAYDCQPREPALNKPTAVETDRPETLLAAVTALGWEEDDDEDDRHLRLSELRRLGIAVADLFLATTTPTEERPGLLRVMELLQARMRELGG